MDRDQVARMAACGLVGVGVTLLATKLVKSMRREEAAVDKKKITPPLTLADIEDYDPCHSGFERPIPQSDYDSMPGSMSGQMHLFASSPLDNTEWASNSTDGHEIQQLLAKGVKGLGMNGVKMGMYSQPCNHSGTDRYKDFTMCDILWFMKMVMFEGVTPEQVEFVLAAIKEGNPDIASEKGVKVNRLQGHHVFVCSHGRRDARCGYCGPPLAHEIEQEARRKGVGNQVSVYKCTHVGGHIYAGNVIIYSEKKGDWYGMVKPSDVPEVVQTCIRMDGWVSRLWRGRLGASEEEQKGMIKYCKA